MDSDSDVDEDDPLCGRIACELLEASRLKRRHWDGEGTPRLRIQGCSLLYDASPQFSTPRVRFDIDDITGITDATCLLFTALHILSYAGYWVALKSPMWFAQDHTHVPVALVWRGCAFTLTALVPNHNERCNNLLEGNLDLAQDNKNLLKPFTIKAEIWTTGPGERIRSPAGAYAQRNVYNGHKRKRVLKLQTIVTPDDMMFHLFGGWHHAIAEVKDRKTHSM
ncbi:LOW QUALITY PROTEIN: hypothetical protein PHMEG_0007553 [Phytophthora megakarya]|uniref:Uncharacterized protein n=1 Tax=Phytophthora megakarya TaxID=4795 RepID=A0A225WM75_9STRA|nr:LOW QUALITY PROTEIN: hypothetical protein PHMEG_0007553 [Phytophthora megakarya]